MTAESFHAQLRNQSGPVPRSCVSGMEGKGREEEWKGELRLWFSHSQVQTERNARDSIGFAR